MSKAELFLYPDYKLSESFRQSTTRCIRIIEFKLSIKISNWIVKEANKSFCNIHKIYQDDDSILCIYLIQQ